MALPFCCALGLMWQQVRPGLQRGQAAPGPGDRLLTIEPVGAWPPHLSASGVHRDRPTRARGTCLSQPASPCTVKGSDCPAEGCPSSPRLPGAGIPMPLVREQTLHLLGKPQVDRLGLGLAGLGWAPVVTSWSFPTAETTGRTDFALSMWKQHVS